MNLLSLADCVEPPLCRNYIQGLRPQIRARVIQDHPDNIHFAELSALQAEELLAMENRNTTHNYTGQVHDSLTQNSLLKVTTTNDDLLGVIALSKNQPSSELKSGIHKCEFCGFSGHLKADCRKRLCKICCRLCRKRGHFAWRCGTSI